MKDRLYIVVHWILSGLWWCALCALTPLVFAFWLVWLVPYSIVLIVAEEDIDGFRDGVREYKSFLTNWWRWVILGK